MKRIVSYFISTAAWLLLIAAVLVTCLQIAVNDRQWFLSEYVKLGTARQAGMSNADMAAALGQLVDYMEGRAQSIQLEVTVNGSKTDMYNRREIDHMVDVRALYQFWLAVRTVGGLAALAVLFLVSRWMRRDALPVLCGSFLRACGVFLVLALAIALWVSVDFSGFWVQFHHLFFTNDLWLLDPATSRMIQICPEELFYDIVTRVGTWFGGILVALLAACILYLAVRRRRHSTPYQPGDHDYEGV